MSTAIEATGFGMCLIAWLVTGAALTNDYWKISTVSGSVIISQRQFENLWHACAENSAGIAECRDFESLLALPAHIQGCRALMIVALLLGLGGMIVALLGVKCIRVGSATDQTKAKMAGTGGILSALAGLCTLIAASWYAYRVVQDFYDPFTAGIRFEMGTGLYLAWGGAALDLLGGALLCSACKRASPKKGSHTVSRMSPKNVVFKKICKDKSVTVYMGRRDFVDRVDSVDPVDGVIAVDTEALQGRKVFVSLSCVFRYGRDDMDVMGIAFRRELYLSTRQVYPPLQDRDKAVHTKTQAKLLRKLGDNAYLFFFEFPDNLPCSVAMQPAPSDVGKQCAVEFEIKAFSAEKQDANIKKRSAVRLMLRKVQFAPESQGAAPYVEATREFTMSERPLQVKANLDKEVYYHGEPIKVHLQVTNNSSKNIKNIIVSVDQVANVVLYSNDSYTKSVDIEESGDSVSAGSSLQKTYTLLPLLANNRERRGIALDGKFKHEDTNLASSSIVKEGVLREVMGIMVSYRVTVKLIIGGELEEELVFQEFKRTYLKGMLGDDDDDEEGNASGGDDVAPKEK